MNSSQLRRDDRPWTLKGWAIENLMIDEVVARLGDHAALGLGWSRSDLAVVRAVRGILCGPTGARVDTEGWFEARLSFGGSELRWFRTGPSTTSAVMLGETGSLVDAGAEAGGTPIATRSGFAIVDVPQILWGTAIEGTMSAGWTSFAEHRIGTRQWPVESPPKGRAEALMREFISNDAHGNAIVAAELLGGFRRSASPKGGDEDALDDASKEGTR